MSPQLDDEVVVGTPASGEMEFVVPGEGRLILDHAVDGPAAARMIVGPITLSRLDRRTVHRTGMKTLDFMPAVSDHDPVELPALTG